MQMRCNRIIGAALSACCLAFVGYASADTVKVGSLVVHAEGGFSPHALPRHRYAPVSIAGEVDVHSTVAGGPPPLKEAVLEFDRDGLLSTRGLATCRAAKIRGASTARARRLCSGAIVGTGHVQAVVPIGLLRVKIRAPLTLFNGPRRGAAATVLAHVQPLGPLGETYVVPVPIERERGAYRYRATIDVPALFGGAGSLTEVDAKVGRRYRFHGSRRSYASARCGDGTLGIRGHFTFTGGVEVEGSIEQSCTALP